MHLLQRKGILKVTVRGNKLNTVNSSLEFEVSE